MKGRWTRLLAAAALASIFALGGCGSDGSDGAPGATGPAGADGADGVDGIDATVDPILQAKAESCATCHGGVGDMHQAEYNKYQGSGHPSSLTLAFDEASLNVVDNLDGTFDVTVDFAATENGAPLAAMTDLGLNNRFYAMEIGADGLFYNSTQRTSISGADGDFTVLWDNLGFDPTADAAIAAWIADETVVIGDVNYAAHMNLWQNVASDGFSTGAAYTSAANVSGCENCHGKPYLKHGERPALAGDLGEFVACRACHYDDRSGGHEDWQYLVDDPYGYATDAAPTGDYAYVANVMNDVHMSHAMEFAYPQSMANCATCHAGKLDMVLTDDAFTMETCKSCHAVEGVDSWPAYTNAAGVEVEAGKYYDSYRAPAMSWIWASRGVGFHNEGQDCQECHTDANPVAVARFDTVHSGYDARITDATDGVKWAEKLTASIDSVDVTDGVITVELSVDDADMVPYVYVSFYGWDSKNMIVASHTRDANRNRMEAAPGDANPLIVFDVEAAGELAYTATIDLSLFEAVETNDILTLIADGVIKTGAITIAPRLYQADGTRLGLDAVIYNFDVSDGSEVADYFTGAGATIDNAKCEACHDKLAVTFHGGSGRSTVEACRNCHVTTNGGSHLEMQSRSIDSYVHAVHSFQPFDIGDVDFTDPVEAMRFEHHTHATFPNFTITNCEACHTAGVYNVPDQAESMPGLLSSSDEVDGRSLTVPEYVTGPASRACGGCHRADLINENEFGELASFNAHTQAGGTLVENDDDDLVLYGIIDKIMSMFQ